MEHKDHLSISNPIEVDLIMKLIHQNYLSMWLTTKWDTPNKE